MHQGYLVFVFKIFLFLQIVETTSNAPTQFSTFGINVTTHMPTRPTMQIQLLIVTISVIAVMVLLFFIISVIIAIYVITRLKS